MLSAKIILEQGVRVEALYFTNVFLPGFSEHQHLHRAAGQLGIQLHIIDISLPQLELVKRPRYGFGENMNPCIDCHILMLKEAKEHMAVDGFSFLVSGEVIGQRPMSQRKDTMNIIDRDAQVKGIVLRPLSAKLLKPTVAEEQGWVDRERLFNFCGRSRKPQLALAKEFGITEYQTPAGGCLLTDAGFVSRCRELLICGSLNLDDVQLLKAGRHFRPAKEHSKIIVGRHKQDNEYLQDLAKNGDILFKMRDFAGPLTLVRVKNGYLFPSELIEMAAMLTARYSQGRGREKVWVEYCPKGSGEKKAVFVSPARDDLIAKIRV